MEINNQNNFDQQAYKRAQARLRKLKGFYVHFAAYIIVNALILFSRYNNLDAHENFFSFHVFSTAFYWGIGLTAHAASVFAPNFIFGRNWEEKKMKQFMEKEKKSNWE